MKPLVLLHDALDAAVRRSPSAPALTFADATLTYAEFGDTTLRAADWLAGHGVSRGDRVVVIAPNHPGVAVLTYACSRIGAVFVLLHEQVRGAGLTHVLADAEPALVITDNVDARDLASAQGAVTVSLEEFSQLVLSANQTAHPSNAATKNAPLSIDPICLIYTSGSTGLPKAVVSTHAQVLFAAQAIQECLGYRADDVIYGPLPLSFDYGLYQLFLSTLAGAHLWLGGSADQGPTLLRNLRRSQATVLPAVPSLADNLAKMLGRYGGTLPLRLLTNTGAAMPEGTVSALRGFLPELHVQLMFGLTECKRVSIMPPDEDLRRPGASGKPLPGTEVFVLDDDGKPVPPGTIGELVVRGPHVMAGYWRRPELTAQRFPRADGLFPELRTGDYGWLDADGFLYFSGRRDDLYKSRGFRVSATEVEAAALRIPGVEAAAVVPPKAGGLTEPVLFAVGKLDPVELLARLRDEIEPYKVPDRCVPIDALPLTSNGKTDRKALEASLGAPDPKSMEQP